MRISLSREIGGDNLRVYVKVSPDDDAQSKLIDSHFFNLHECQKGLPFVTEVFTDRPLPWLRIYGKTLFGALFSTDESRPARQRLRQMISSQPPGRVLLDLNHDRDLESILWEYTWAGDEYLVLQCMFARVDKRKEPHLPKLSLRIVAVVPDPVIPPDESDTYLPDLHLSGQFQNFIDGHNANTKKVVLERVFPPTLDRMDALLMNKSEAATVLHFMGHCGWKNGARALIFEDKATGKHEFVDTSHLSILSKTVQLAFLSACDTRDVARILFELGVPYTIGSSCSLPDDLARKFESKFYQLLAGGLTVEMAMWKARVLLHNRDDVRQRDYFPGAMVLYSSMLQEADGVFKCEEGKPTVQLHMPPHNLESIPSTSIFFGRKNELDELYSVLGRMTNRETQSPSVCTIEGIGGQGKTALAMEAVRRMAHFFPGGVFAWQFDRTGMSVIKYLWCLVEVIFPDEIQSRLKIPSGTGDVERLGLAISKEFVGYPTCLLLLDNADTLMRAKAGDKDAMALGKWLREITLSNSAVKILATSCEPLGWTGEITMHLNGLIDSDIASSMELFLGSVGDLRARERMKKETQLLQDLARSVSGHPLSLVRLGRAASQRQHSGKLLEDIVREHCGTMLTNSTCRSESLKECFRPTIDVLSTRQRLVLYMCCLFTGPITEGMLEFIPHFVNYAGVSAERTDFSIENIVRDLQHLEYRGLLSKMNDEYTVHVALREAVKQYNAELPGLYDNTCVMGIVESSKHGRAGSVKNGTFCVHYYSIENAGLRIIDIRYINNYSRAKFTELQQEPFRRLVVFTCKASEITESFSRICRKQIIPIVEEEKLPFVLCFNHADAAFAEHPAAMNFIRVKRAFETLRASLEKTHRIIMTEAPSGFIETLSTFDNPLESEAAAVNDNTFLALNKDLVDIHMNGNFVGREFELEWVGKLLHDDGIRYITIHGFGGIGKTSLALQAVRNIKSCNVLALSLVQTSKSSQVIRKIARFLKIDIKNLESRDLQSEVLRALTGEKFILFLDSMEGVKQAIDNGDLNARDLIKFLQRTPNNVKILVTSRTALGWLNEELVELDGLTPHDGMHLFQQWIPHRRNDVDNADARKLSHLVHGHPLSIRLLGGVFNNYKETIEQFIRNIQERPPEAKSSYSFDMRRESIDFCIQYSFDQLDITLKPILRRLRMFEVPFSSTLAMRALTHDTISLSASVEDILHKLWQHSWLSRRIYKHDQTTGDWRPRIIEKDTQFYSLHPRIRDFLNDQFCNVEGGMSNDPEIQFYTALCYGVGFGVGNDLEKQIAWCTEAAKNGHLEAQLILGTCYEQGACGVAKDKEKAFYWNLMAAEAGDRGAQFGIEQCYLKGDGVDRDLNSGKCWAKRAKENATKPLEIKFDLTLPLLHRAAGCGEMTLIRTLMEQPRPEVDVRDRHEGTPLHAAAQKGLVEVVKLLVVNYGATTNAKDKEGKTPLHKAAENGHAEIVRLLVAEFGADANAKDNNGSTPLHWAACGGCVEVVSLFVTEFGADTNIKGHKGRSPLHWAARYGHIEIMRLLVAKFGADPNAKDNNGWTPLHLAAEEGNIEVVRLLVAEFGADATAKDDNGQMPLHHSASNGHVEVVKMLVAEFGTDVNVKSHKGWAPLHLAAKNGHVEVVKLLVNEFGTDANVKSYKGQEPLHRPTSDLHVGVVRLDSNAKDNCGRTPLHLAAEEGHVEVVRLLVAEDVAGANGKDNDGRTPLHLATAEGHVKVVRLLLAEFGTDVNAKDNNGCTPLHLAVEGGHGEIVKLLKTELGVDANAKNNDGQTPLHRVAIQEKALGLEHLDTVMTLENPVKFYENQREYDQAEMREKDSELVDEQNISSDTASYTGSYPTAHVAPVARAVPVWSMVYDAIESEAQENSKLVDELITVENAIQEEEPAPYATDGGSELDQGNKEVVTESTTEREYLTLPYDVDGVFYLEEIEVYAQDVIEEDDQILRYDVDDAFKQEQGSQIEDAVEDVVESTADGNQILPCYVNGELEREEKMSQEANVESTTEEEDIIYPYDINVALELEEHESKVAESVNEGGVHADSVIEPEHHENKAEEVVAEHPSEGEGSIISVDVALQPEQEIKTEDIPKNKAFKGVEQLVIMDVAAREAGGDHDKSQVSEAGPPAESSRKHESNEDGDSGSGGVKPSDLDIFGDGGDGTKGASQSPNANGNNEEGSDGDKLLRTEENNSAQSPFCSVWKRVVYFLLLICIPLQHNNDQ